MHSSLANQVRPSWQRSSRLGAAIDTFLIHHQAGTNDNWVIDAMVSGSKQVSANYTISNEGRLTCVVPEEFRAWTSGSTSDGGKGAAWDRRAITVEIENQAAGPYWPISDAALDVAAALLADLRKRYRIANVLGHKDLWQRFRASYATACPGTNTVQSILSRGAGSVPAGNVGGSTGGDGVDYDFGLTKAAMLATQKALARLGRYSGVQDGIFGAMSVSSLQRWLRDNDYLEDGYPIDGFPGPLYGRAVQSLAKRHGYTGPIDGKPGPATSAAIERWAATVAVEVEQVREDEPAGPDWSYWEPRGELAKRVQRALARRGRYSGPIDGVFGANTRKGVQLTLANADIFRGVVDGKIARGGTFGIQKYAKKFGSYTGPIDGAPRAASWTGFALGLERP